MKTFTIYGDTKIKYKTSPEINQKVVDKIIEWCEKYSQGSGEDLHQSDDGIIYSPDLVATIIDDILEFEYDEE